MKLQNIYWRGLITFPIVAPMYVIGFALMWTALAIGRGIRGANYDTRDVRPW